MDLQGSRNKLSPGQDPAHDGPTGSVGPPTGHFPECIIKIDILGN